MKKIQMKNSFLLLLTAAIWGVAFVAQSVGMEYVEPFTFTAVRSIMVHYRRPGADTMYLVSGQKKAQTGKDVPNAEAGMENAAGRRRLLWRLPVCCQ